MIESLVTYPGLVFVGLILMLTLDTFTGDIPPLALVPFAVATVLVIVLI